MLARQGESCPPNTAIFRPHLARLPDDRLKTAFVDALASQAAADPVPFELDYWRLDIDATRPR